MSKMSEMDLVLHDVPTQYLIKELQERIVHSNATQNQYIVNKLINLSAQIEGSIADLHSTELF